MDFDKIIEGYTNKACIISVERFEDGTYGNIRLAAGNKAHCDDMLNVMHRPFIPDSPYEEYLPQNKNFEDYCYRSAFLGESLHTYVSVPQIGLWLNMYLHSLASDKENTGYCVYIYDVSPNADSEKQANLSADTSAAVLKTCIKLRGAGDIRQTFREVIEDIRGICDSDHCCILLTDPAARSCMNLCESLKPGCGLLPMDTYLGEEFYSITETWKDTLGSSTCVIIKDQHDMDWLRSINPIWHGSLTSAGAKSIVMFPLKYNNETLGYMWAINFNVENVVKIKETLELTTFFIASEIANYQLLNKLEVLSSTDMLTGVMNRNEMNNYVESLSSDSSGKTAGVIFADLNGLKAVNDGDGHTAGDALLKNAANALREVFAVHEIFRAGGDEFVVILTDVTEEELNGKSEKLRQVAENYEKLVFAVGSAYEDDVRKVRLALHNADERMYADKKCYYELHPEKKRAAGK